MRRITIGVVAVLLLGIGVATAWGLGTTGTVTACATSPVQTISANGVKVGTISPKVACTTVTYTVPTQTVTATVTTVLTVSSISTATYTQPSTVPTTTAPPPPPPGQVFLSPTGNDANACTPGSPCLTLQRGFDVAQPGQTVSVAAGTYPGGQTLTGNKAVKFALDPNAIIGDISGTGQLNLAAAHNVEFDGGQIPAVALQFGPSSFITFRNVVGGRIYTDDGSSDLNWIGGSIGPNQCSSGTGNTYLNTLFNATRVTFDGVTIHGQKGCSPGEHTESLRIDQGSSFITVKNSTFSDNDDSTAAIFMTTQQQGVGMPHDITITNNTFNQSGTNKMIWTQDPNVTTCTNYTITNNRYFQVVPDSFLTLNCQTQSGVVVSGNTGF